MPDLGYEPGYQLLVYAHKKSSLLLLILHLTSLNITISLYLFIYYKCCPGLVARVLTY